MENQFASDANPDPVRASLGIGRWALLIPLLPEVASFIVMRSLVALNLTLPALSGAIVYSCCCWIVVGWVWRAAAARGATAEIFPFRRPRPADFAWAASGLILGVAIFPISERLSLLWLGKGIHGMRFDLSRPEIVAVIFAWAIASAPFCEEALFRGLAVAKLRSTGAATFVVATLPTLMFAAIHVPYFGWAGAQYILFWGTIVMALRLVTGSLTAGFMMGRKAHRRKIAR